ncbi:hypothetical protein P3W85_23570 [Cupriavidus basilensis]|uniref:Uncharacterized protein n=1 Tax=Cupriavidus basilensis TaxID=68895 RepID=A0ABT6ATF1_9BURK|nr:hypothetical protein [Cupriavidus basilensis]MDF3835905.1 hypothetical protein [Cupriavidus basilensis]
MRVSLSTFTFAFLLLFSAIPGTVAASGTPASPPQNTEKWKATEKLWANKQIGKYYWVHPTTGSNTTTFLQTAETLSPKRKPSFEVTKIERVKVVRVDTDGIERGNTAYWLYVQFDDSVVAMVPAFQVQRASASARPTDLFNNFTSVDPKVAARKEGVSIGMTREQALRSSWGKPRAVNSTHTAQGTREQWVYDGGYLYFKNGTLESVQN